MQTEILVYSTRFAIQTVLLVGLIWTLFKAQKLKANFFRLLALAALAGGLDMIPHYGHYVAGLVLLLGLFKFTNANITGATLTSVFSCGVIFALNFYFGGALMGGLKVAARSYKPVARLVGQEIALDSTTNDYAVSSAQPIAKLPPEIAKDFSLKGVSVNAKNSFAMIHVGENTYTIGIDELIPVDTAKGKMMVRCEGVNEHSALLIVDGQQLQLFLR